MSPDDEAMPTWVKVSLIIGILLVVGVIATGLLGIGNHGPGQHGPGQHSSSGDTGAADSGSGAGPLQACQAQPFEHGGGSGAELTCEDAEGPGQLAQGFTCENPGHGGAELDWNLSAGAFTVTVTDAVGTTVFSETYEGKGSESAGFTQSQPGSWELEATRGEGFLGSFTVQAFCSN